LLCNQRGIHDINRAFSFKNNPEFIFHDSPGFETGDEKQLREVQSFIEQRGKAGNVKDQLHAIWPVLFLYFIIFTHALLQVLFYTKQIKVSTGSGEEVFQ
jgi:hypothetical protein